jgi:hypothetical protein
VFMSYSGSDRRGSTRSIQCLGDENDSQTEADMFASWGVFF